MEGDRGKRRQTQKRKLEAGRHREEAEMNRDREGETGQVEQDMRPGQHGMCPLPQGTGRDRTRPPSLWVFVNSHQEPHDADCGPHQTVGHVSHMCVCLKYMGVWMCHLCAGWTCQGCPCMRAVDPVCSCVSLRDQCILRCACVWAGCTHLAACINWG